MPTPNITRHEYAVHNHRLERFLFANSTDQAAGTNNGETNMDATPYTIQSSDVGQVAYRTDTNTYWRLAAFGPPLVWLQITGSGSGGVTNIATGPGLTGGPITSTGTISAHPDGVTLDTSGAGSSLEVKAAGIGPTQLANTSVIAGSYGDATHVAQVSVDAQGRLTSASNVAISFPSAFTPGSAVAPDFVRSVAVYNGNSEYFVFRPEYTTNDPYASGQTYQWQYSLDSGTTWLGPDLSSSTYFTQTSFVFFITSGTLLARCRAQGLLGDTSGWTLSPNQTYSANPTTGTVSSVSLSMPADFGVTGSPITNSGTLAVTWATQSANLIFAGPSSGGAATPTWRSLVLADLPSLANNTLVGNTSGGSSTPSALSIASLQGTSVTTFAAGNDSRFTTITANNQTGTSYTLVASDAGKVIELNNAAAITLTIPPVSSVAWAVGTVIEVWQQGAGQVTITAGTGVTLRSDGSKVKTAGQYATVALRMRANDEWVLSGDLG